MNHNKKIIAVIVAAGNGTRFDSIIPKQYYYLHNKMVVEYSLDLLKKISLIDGILLVINEEHEQFYKNIKQNYNIIDCINGGGTRFESIKNAIGFLKKYSPDYVLIHDACRPLISANFINSLLINISNDYQAICPALAINETIKEIDGSNVLNVNRTNKYIIQTPQIVEFNTYSEILTNNAIDCNSFTDDSSLIEAFRGAVRYVDGRPENIKITHKNDLEFAKKMLEKTQFRTGIGFDVHKFDSHERIDNFIMLGGVKVPSTKAIIAHSDGDVVIHALVDAILGAIGEGDIGEHFPDTDPKWKNQDSVIFLKHACSLLINKNASISNVDIIIVCEKPKILPYKNQIKETLSNYMNITKEQINVKATTTEKMGFTGRGEGIAVYATIMVSV